MSDSHSPASSDDWALFQKIIRKLMEELDLAISSTPEELRTIIEELFQTVLADEKITLSRAERNRLLDSVRAEILGFGPLEVLLADPSIREISVIGAKNVHVRRGEKWEKSPVTFENEDHVLRILDRIFSPLRKSDGLEFLQIATAHLPDGSRVTAMVRPVTAGGPSLVIRKFTPRPTELDAFLKLGTLTDDTAAFLQACAQAGLNIIVSGACGSGKTTLLSLLANFIPDGNLLITIENVTELWLKQEQVLSLQSHPPMRNEITLQRLIEHAFEMRPHYVIVEEIATSGECLALFQPAFAWMTTLTSFDPANSLEKVEALNQLELDRPLTTIRKRIAESVDLIVHIDRLSTGSHKVTAVCEVGGLNADGEIVLNQIFGYEGLRKQYKGDTEPIKRLGQPGALLHKRLTSAPVEESLIRKMEALFSE